ncbi:hypothetical protein BJV78DRAFT_425049 [Lactifluus subvellereus]|nr:hypothetical protein BJV78DRAFT_425049 [Lactifluus subvellereus]
MSPASYSFGAPRFTVLLVEGGAPGESCNPQRTAGTNGTFFFSFGICRFTRHPPSPLPTKKASHLLGWKLRSGRRPFIMPRQGIWDPAPSASAWRVSSASHPPFPQYLTCSSKERPRRLFGLASHAGSSSTRSGSHSAADYSKWQTKPTGVEGALHASDLLSARTKWKDMKKKKKKDN